MNRGWKVALPVVFASAALLIAVPAFAQSVRIISIDGRMLGDRGGEPVQVWPGQVISLVADEVWTDGGRVEYAYRPVEDFVWTADDVPGDTCDPEQDCRAGSNFEATDYGVNFYVPRDAPHRFQIRVHSKYLSGIDRVEVINEGRSDRWRDGSDYGLGGYGWWTTVGGDRVFVPYAYEDDWVPYQHGYWYWTRHGWTWYSYDPWGEITDHYGHWRHHGVYGWVWMPDPGWMWRAAVVSFFFGDGWIGWWPYDGAWSHGYRHGYADGWDDGYWMGYWAGRRVGDYPGRRSHPGATCVAYNDFMAAHAGPPPRAGEDRRSGRAVVREHDMARVRIVDRSEVERNLNGAVRAGQVGALPGGGSSLPASRQFIAGKTGVLARETPMKPVSAPVGSMQRSGFAPVKPVFQAPASYRGIGEKVRNTLAPAKADGVPGVRVPIARPQARLDAQGEAVRPGRGVAPAPVIRGEDRTKVETWAPRPRSGTGIRAPAENLRPSQAVPDRSVDRGQASPGRTQAQPAWQRTAPREVPEVRGREVEPRRTVDVDRGTPEPSSYQPTWQRTAPREVPEVRQRTVAPERSYQPQQVRPQQVQPRQVQPSRAVPRTETRAPEPATRREAPRQESPSRTYVPSRSSFGSGSSSGSSGSSTPPPAYAPPKPRSPAAPAPSRAGPGTRRTR